MEFERKIVLKKTAYTLEKITGSVKNKKKKRIPFVGYLFTIPKKESYIEISHSPKGKRLSRFVAENRALAGINGGFYDTTSKAPLNLLKLDGHFIKNMNNDQRPCLYIDKERSLIDVPDPLKFETFGTILQAGPLLLKDNIIETDYSDFKSRAFEFDSDITADRYPRTVFGFDETQYYALVINGRSLKSAGLFLDEAAELIQGLGAINAINLDGGSSSTLIVENRLINLPRISIIRNSRILSSRVPGKERKISNALLIYGVNDSE